MLIRQMQYFCSVVKNNSFTAAADECFISQSAVSQLTEIPDSIDDYDKIILCYPNYWGTMPMAVFTFLEKFDFGGKIILPLCTHEGSGMGHSEKDIKMLCPNSDVKSGLAVRGGKVSGAKTEIENWLNKNL